MSGVTYGFNVAPIFIPIESFVTRRPRKQSNSQKRSKSHEIIEKPVLTKEQFLRELERLMTEKNVSIKEASKILGLSMQTVRHYCRTRKWGPYRELKEGERRSRSSQVPFGWDRKGGVLIPHSEEQKWLSGAIRWRREGESLHEIARRSTKAKVSGKNGSRTWHARSISRILEVNERMKKEKNE